ncbi:hypothetical protein MFLAVUS_007665 [Mucor flavus]|uniref:Uncharacterized protein n=1 Tax=Mucor flavus TaxID=439312 RepID=A0ABP9Z4Y5_9FUNG
MHTSVLFLVALASMTVSFSSAKPLDSAGKGGGGGLGGGPVEEFTLVHGGRGGRGGRGVEPPLVGDVEKMATRASDLMMDN